MSPIKRVRRQFINAYEKNSRFDCKKSNPLHINLLKEEGVNPSDINDYLHEEFTHSVAANAILAGKADVGGGVKNIAIEHGLGFVPLRDEIFFIAMSKEMAKQMESSKLICRIRSASGDTPGRLNRQIQEWL